MTAKNTLRGRSKQEAIRERSLIIITTSICLSRSRHIAGKRADVELLLADIKAYLRGNPKRVDGLKADPNRIGERLVYHNQTEYLADRPAAQWSIDLKPRPRHWDRRIDVQVSVEETGAYLVESKMNDGNASRIIVWITDTTIVQKPLHQKTLYVIADAKSGDAS